MKRCYNFIGPEKCGQFVAKLPEITKINNLEMNDYLINTKSFPSELILKPLKDKYIDTPVIWHDYMYNEFAYFIVSERFKKFLVDVSTENDCIEWISVNIRYKDIVKKYYTIMFQEAPDIIDSANTTFLPNSSSFLVPCISIEKAEKYSVFPLRMANGHFPSLLYTTESIKKEMQNEKFSNLIFEKVKTSFNGIVIK